MKQHEEALKLANHRYRAQAKIKRRILNERWCICQVIMTPPECMLKVCIHKVLEAQRRWKVKRTNKFLAECGISHTRHMGNLTLRERRVLIKGLNEIQGG